MLGGTGEKLDWAKATKSRLKTVPGVKEVYGVLGRYDLVAMVEVDALEKLASLIADVVRSVPGIQTSETLTVIF